MDLRTKAITAAAVRVIVSVKEPLAEILRTNTALVSLAYPAVRLCLTTTCAHTLSLSLLPSDRKIQRRSRKKENTEKIRENHTELACGTSAALWETACKCSLWFYHGNRFIAKQ